MWQNSGRLAAHYKSFGFPKFGVPQAWGSPLATAHCVFMHQLACFVLLYRIRAWGAGTNADTLATAGKLNKEFWFFISEPGASCLLPASVNLWQANLSVSKFQTLPGSQQSNMINM